MENVLRETERRTFYSRQPFPLQIFNRNSNRWKFVQKVVSLKSAKSCMAAFFLLHCTIEYLHLDFPNSILDNTWNIYQYLFLLIKFL